MTLWKLWRNIGSPAQYQTSPLYAMSGAPPPPLSNWLSCLFIFGALLFIAPLILFMSTVAGAIGAATSSFTMSRERESGRFDLLSTTPAGTFGVSWLVGLGAIHRRKLYQRLNMELTWIFRVSVILLGFSMVQFAVVGSPANTEAQFVLGLILFDLFLVLLAFYVDHVQALTLGVLVGMLIPTFISDRFSTQIAAVVYYLFWRSITLVIGAAVVLFLLPLLFDSVWMFWWSRLLYSLIRFSWFVAVNEIITIVLWQGVQRRFGADHQTMQSYGLPIR